MFFEISKIKLFLQYFLKDNAVENPISSLLMFVQILMFVQKHMVFEMMKIQWFSSKFCKFDKKINQNIVNLIKFTPNFPFFIAFWIFPRPFSLFQQTWFLCHKICVFWSDENFCFSSKFCNFDVKFNQNSAILIKFTPNFQFSITFEIFTSITFFNSRERAVVDATKIDESVATYYTFNKVL